MKPLLLLVSGGCCFLQLSRYEAFTISPRDFSSSKDALSRSAMAGSSVRKAVGVRSGQWREAGVERRSKILCAAAGIGSRQEEKREEEEDQAAEEIQQEGFDWTRQWYPVAVTRDLDAMDPRKPYPVKLLGEALVVWRKPGGEWQCFADRCPHRWAPLSEGRVDQKTGRLQCIYHGWEFEEGGKCGVIPQADAAVRENAQASKRACATVIPTTVVQGKLWVWPDSSPEGVKASEHASPAVVPEMDSDDFGGNWYARDLPYGFDTLLENLADPAHVPFAHHGVMGTRALGTPMDIKMQKGGSEDSFKTQGTGFSGSRNMVVGFEAPSLVYYRSDYTEALPIILKRVGPPVRALAWVLNALKLDKRIAMKPEERTEPSDALLNFFVGYAVPTSPGKSRIFTRTARNFLLQHPVIPRRWRNSLAIEHLGQHLVLDGDTTALHIQERALVDAGEQGLAQAERTFYMPTDADSTVRTLRKWYNSRGGGGPPWAKGVDPSRLGPVLPREQLLDRMEAHTRDCSACGKAYRVSGKVKRASIAAALVLVAVAAVAPRGPLAVWTAGSAVACSGLAAAMAKRQQKFVFVDYVHASRDG